MGLKGIAIGGAAGFFFGGGPLGALFGAVLGNRIERELRGEGSLSRRIGRAAGRSAARDAGARNRERIFCASAAAMLAKMAKADGRVSADEIESVEMAFRRLGFSPEARRFAVDVFRRAKDDGHTIYEYAGEFAAAVRSVEVRELFYELLWDLACADGRVGAAEMEILRRIPVALGIRPQWFNLFAAERLPGGPSSAGGREMPRPDALADAYAALDIEPSASDDEVKRAYRTKAKKYHPDTLRAQGLPESLMKKATDMMSKVNAAWMTIKEARHL